VQAQILRLLLDLRDRLGFAMILVTPDLGVVAETCDAAAVMYAGRIVEQAPKRELLNRPLHPYSEALMRAQPDTVRAGSPLLSIAGQPPSPAALPRGCRFHRAVRMPKRAAALAMPILTPWHPASADSCLRCAGRARRNLGIAKAAALFGIRTARMKAAATRQSGRRRRLPRDRKQGEPARTVSGWARISASL